MPDIFESDFNDFIAALNISGTEYLVVGGYAVILHGYYRTTQDLDIWVNKTPQNHLKLSKAFAIFGMPLFDMTLENFMGDRFDVFSMGRTPIQIDIITKLKGLEFKDAIHHAVQKEMEGIKVKYLNLDDLLKAKKASGRHKDLDDIEKLSQ
ncbi:MAG: nucleotidyltransferase [Ferruginibacter sp.]